MIGILQRTNAFSTVAFTVRRLGLLVLAATTLSVSVAWAEEPSYELDIPAQDLNSALKSLAVETDRQVLFSAAVVNGYKSPAVNGEYSTTEAMDILLADSDLTYDVTESNVLLIKAADSEQRGASDSKNLTPQPVLMAQNQTTASSTQGAQPESTRDPSEEAPLLLEEIIVVGTNIRGAKSVSPVATYSRGDIDLTGVSTVPQFLQTLPQNFGGGLSEGTQGVIGDSGTNINTGSGINLRGLGNQSTLVLLNGRRLAPAGIGEFVDVSMIPLSAIESVEVLTDGASAIYGSDAVGGVVNFKLRTDYDGAETRLRYGSATSGDLDEIQVAQTFGTVWGSGNALLSYEYSDRHELDSEDRSFSKDADDPLFLLPRQERHSVFAAVRQEVSDNAELFGDAFFSDRGSESNTESSGLPSRLSRDTEQLGVSLGVRAGIGKTFEAEFIGAFSEADVSGRIDRFLQPDLTEFDSTRELDQRTSSTWTIDGKVDGTLLHTGGGEVRAAIGGQYRNESYEGIQSSNSAEIDESRDIYAVFGELSVPVVGAANQVSGIHSLDLTVAARYEDYCDFGSSTDTKLGILWSPIEGLDIRATRGTSFRAPILDNLDVENTNVGFLLFFPDPSAATGSTLAALARGGNADLQPETATTWTAGFDFNPKSIESLNINVTYFSIEYEDRIAAGQALFDAFTDPRWGPIIDRSPDQALLTFLGNQPFSSNFAPGFEFTDAEALIDNRLRNLASVETSGLDFAISYAIPETIGSLSLSLGGTYLIEQKERLIETDQPVDVIGTAFNPPDLKLRGNASWSVGNVSVNVGINHISSFEDERADPVADIDEWTTVDLNLTYRTEESSVGWINDTEFALTALNVFDQDPPFVQSFFDGREINYDPSNANALGRTLALQITKRW